MEAHLQNHPSGNAERADAGSFRPLPFALKMVAGLWILWGAGSAIGLIVALAHGHLSIQFGVVGIPVGIGLLRLSRGWRLVTIGLLILARLLCVYAVIQLALEPATLVVSAFGIGVAMVPAWVIIAANLLLFVLLCWQHVVLNRKEVKALFGVPAHDGQEDGIFDS